MSRKTDPEDENYEFVELCQGCGRENCDDCPCGTYTVRRKKEKRGGK